MSVNEWPDPTAFTVCPAAPAAFTAATSSASPPGWSTASAAQVWLRPQLVHSSLMSLRLLIVSPSATPISRAPSLSRGYCPRHGDSNPAPDPDRIPRTAHPERVRGAGGIRLPVQFLDGARLDPAHLWGLWLLRPIPTGASVTRPQPTTPRVARCGDGGSLGPSTGERESRRAPAAFREHGRAPRRAPQHDHGLP